MRLKTGIALRRKFRNVNEFARRDLDKLHVTQEFLIDLILKYKKYLMVIIRCIIMRFGRFFYKA
jgi:hypothetical protein